MQPNAADDDGDAAAQANCQKIQNRNKPLSAHPLGPRGDRLCFDGIRLLRRPKPMFQAREAERRGLALQQKTPQESSSHSMKGNLIS